MRVMNVFQLGQDRDEQFSQGGYGWEDWRGDRRRDHGWNYSADYSWGRWNHGWRGRDCW